MVLLHTQEVGGSNPPVPTIFSKAEGGRGWVVCYLPFSAFHSPHSRKKDVRTFKMEHN